MGVHTSSSTSWSFYVSDVVVNHTQPSFMPPLIDTHGNCAVNFGDFWHGCSWRNGHVFWGLDEIGWCGAAILGFNYGYNDMQRRGAWCCILLHDSFQFLCCHITAFSKKLKQTSEVFCKNSDEAARQQLYHGLKWHTPVGKYKDAYILERKLK